MKHKHSAFGYYSLTLFFVVAVVIVCLKLFELDANNPDGAVGQLMPFIVSVLSLLIAFLAFTISVKTYTSIDSVNSMTMMDGNIMENENYKTNIVLLLKALDESAPEHCSSRRFRLFDKEGNLSMRPVECYMSKAHSLVDGDFISGVRFADNIQKLMDYIIVLPYFTNSADKDIRTFAQERAGQLKTRLESEVQSYASLSEGSTVLLQENARLLGEILKLQNKRTDGAKMNNVRITGVRGSMMRNPVSRTLYHHYAGIYYYNMALEIMAESLGSTRKDMFTVAIIGLVSTPGKLSDVAKHKALLYLDLALAEFDRALGVIGDDLMWRSMIYYNIARASFYKMAVSGVTVPDWERYIDDAIRFRTDLNYIIADAVNSDTYLVRAFKDEETLARMTKFLFRIALDNTVAGDPAVKAEWEKLVKDNQKSIDADAYQMLNHPYEDITKYLVI